ncbi:MAG TPA: hypothetical protein VGZ00_09950 [Candidatus Baltobacteraceae bacterium]|jgi:hypothetical protein|nr:hypothetical protein [Candidatus Baltobacteraceae bacterium]
MSILDRMVGSASPHLTRSFIALLSVIALLGGVLLPSSAADAGVRPGGQVQVDDFLRGSSCGIEIAQANGTPSPEVSTIPSPSPSPVAGGATPPAAVPQSIPLGPVQLIPPRQSATAPPPPLPTPTPAATASGAIFIAPPGDSPPDVRTRGTVQTLGPSPTPSASASPEAWPTLGPHEMAIRADRGDRLPEVGHPADLDGHIAIYFQEGTIVGGHAHFDGQHTWTLKDHPYLINRSHDSILHADHIDFDTQTRRAILFNAHGETIEGVERGELYFSAQMLNATGKTSHGTNAVISTCQNPRGGYHILSKSIDVTPGDRIIARHNYVYLGAMAVFYIPLIVIPLDSQAASSGRRRPIGFIPELGYDQTDGFFIRAKIGFGTSDRYYGDYRIDYYTKRGLGLGYDATIAPANHKRVDVVSIYTIDDKIAGQRETNASLQDTENFSRTLRGQFGASYTGDYGAGISIPAALNFTGSLNNTGVKSTEGLTFTSYTQGSLSDNLNLGFTDQTQLSSVMQQGFNISETHFASSDSSSDSLHLNTLTHLTTHSADYNLTIDKTDSTTPTGYDKLPELQILPHYAFPGIFKTLQTQATLGDYTEPENHFSTSRADLGFRYPLLFRVFGSSELSTSVNVDQYLYGTGDEKAEVSQQAALSTPLGSHFINSITYNEEHPIGPEIVPFQLLDNLSSAYKQASDVFRFYNKNVYSLTLSSGTSFIGVAQPVQYQLSLNPSSRSIFNLGGSWIPGPGNGFETSNVQLATPFGFATDIALTTNVDWKNKGRLEDKTIEYHKIIGNCYEFRLGYNQDLKTYLATVDILAFPSQAATFGINQAGPIIPGSLAY